MTESAILYESKHFWICKAPSGYSINLKVTGKSYGLGEKPNLDAAKSFVEKCEKYPNNIKYLLPRELHYEVESFQKSDK